MFALPGCCASNMQCILGITKQTTDCLLCNDQAQNRAIIAGEGYLGDEETKDYVKKLIGIKGLSEHLNVSVNTIYSWTSMKVIPFYKIGRLVKFDEIEIDKWLEQRKQQVSKYADEYWEK